MIGKNLQASSIKRQERFVQHWACQLAGHIIWRKEHEGLRSVGCSFMMAINSPLSARGRGVVERNI